MQRHRPSRPPGDIRPIALAVALMALACALRTSVRAVPAKPLAAGPRLDAQVGELIERHQVQPVKWGSDLETAVSLATKQNKPIFVCFTSPTCAWCQRLDTETLQSPDVRARLASFIPLKIDIFENEKVAARFRVRSTPTLLILSPEGRESARAEGFIERTALLRLLGVALGNKLLAQDENLFRLLDLLKESRLPETNWTEVILALADEKHREVIVRTVVAVTPQPRKECVRLLEHPLLAVRLGALELLEELAGDDFGFNPWHDPQSENADALQKWSAWTVATNEVASARRYKVLSEDEIASYLRDLVSDNHERASRARWMLQRGGVAALKGIEAFLAGNAALPPGTVNKLREVRYSLILPSIQGLDSSTVAHRLVFGNLDVRLRTLRDISLARQRALPVIQDYLPDPEPLVRETAVDAVASAAGRKAVPVLQQHLAREQNANVTYAVLKQLGNLRSKTGLNILTGYIDHANEDLAIVALESIARLRSDTVAPQVEKALSDARWRVRVAALKTAQLLRLKALSEKVTALLEDSDEFVRGTAVETIAALASKGSGEQLEKLFYKYDSLKGPVIRALYAADLPIREQMVNALHGKEPSLLLGILGDVESADLKLLPLFRWLAAHPDADVASTALRRIAETGLEHSPYQKIVAEQVRSADPRRLLAVMTSARIRPEVLHRLTGAGRQVDLDAAIDTGKPEKRERGEVDDVFAAFDQPSATTIEPAKAGTNAVDDVFSAFEGAKAGSEDFVTTFVRVGKEALEKPDGDQRFTAAAFLLHFADTSGVDALLGHWSDLTIAQRTRIAADIGRVRRKEAAPLIQRLLRDEVAEVRETTIEGLLEDGANESCIRLLFAELLRPGAQLKCHELYNPQFQEFARKAAFRAAINQHAIEILKSAKDEMLVTFALILLKDAWSDDTTGAVLPFIASGNPWHRRAAFHALGKKRPEDFLGQLAGVVDDPSEYVRAVVPAVYAAGSTSGSWTHHFNQEKTVGDFDFTYVRSGRRTELPEQIAQALIKLTTDRSDLVRFEAYYCLLTHRQPVDLAGMVSVIEKLPRDSAALERVSDYVRSNYRELGKSFAVLLPYLDFNRRNTSGVRLFEFGDQPADQETAILAHFGLSEDGGDSPLVSEPARIRERVEATFIGSVTNLAVATSNENFTIVFFIKPGCDLCESVRRKLAQLRDPFPALDVVEYDINKASSVLLNEALSERFDVPQNVRLVAPAIFTGAGYLVKDEITVERLGQMLQRASTVPLAGWLVVPEPELETARQLISERYQSTSAVLILAAGFLDGINPCAFATIIFLLSYLQVTRKKPREIAQIGLAYIAGVFLAYLFIGMGLLKITAAVAELRWIGHGLNYVMAAFALVIMALSVRDGVRCLHGQMQEMTLQLPAFLKDRIHSVIRDSVRQAHFVLMAFVLGATISMLELACTGQVYLPTITYMIQQGETGALLHLVSYNLAFITPLTVIFVMACYGLRSETLLSLLKKRAALVKFSTAALFLALFLFLMLGDRLVH